MPKNKFNLSKKHQWLIDATIYELPEPWKRDFDVRPDNRGEGAKNAAIVTLMKTVRMLTRNTQLENSADEFLEKCHKIFDTVSDIE